LARWPGTRIPTREWRIAGADGRGTGLEGLHRLDHLLAELDDGQVAGAQAVEAAVGDRPIESHMATSWFGKPVMPVKLPAFMAWRSCQKRLSRLRSGRYLASRSTPTVWRRNLRQVAVSGVCDGWPQAMK
jgi:hypothetical protein